MISLVENLTIYLKTGKKTDTLAKIEVDTGQRMLRLISLNIIEWLKLEGKIGKAKHLKLNQSYPWCRQLEKLVDEESEFSAVFTITNGELSFNDSISDNDKNEARLYCVENHTPTRMK